MDVVIPVGMSAIHEDLRYSMRSFVANVPHDHVWIVGDAPRWLSDAAGHLPLVQGSDRWRNTSDALLEAIYSDQVSDPFIYSNDDFFAIRPWPRLDFDRGLLIHHTVDKAKMSPYRNGFLHAVQTLTELDIDEGALSYELHIPIVVHKADMEAAIGVLRAHRRNEAFKRTIYGNLRDMNSTSRNDVKVDDLYVPSGDEDWISTTDSSFQQGKAGQWLRERFPEACKYERKS